MLNMPWFKNPVLKDYETRLLELREAAKLSGLTDQEIDHTLNESILYIRNRSNYIHRSDGRKKTFQLDKRRAVIAAVVSLLLVAGYCSNIYKPLHNLVERNIQGIIYPFMTFYRRATLPIIAYFPALTAFYDESCLVENPYFHVVDIECWPCESARFVLNLTDTITKAHIGLPFLIKSVQAKGSFSDIRSVYLTNKDLIDHSTVSGNLFTNIVLKRIEDIFEKDELEDPFTHIAWPLKIIQTLGSFDYEQGTFVRYCSPGWIVPPNEEMARRINRMEVGRVLRPLLVPPLPDETPNHASSMGIERFVLIDGPSAEFYPLPSTEGANVFIKQLAGERMIVLEPSPECFGSCRKLSVLLEKGHILWYNWWYWRPRSHPTNNSSSTSIAFVGSTS